MTAYMTLPPKFAPRSPFLPVGTKVTFIKELSCEASGDHPAFLYAPKNGTGVVTGHGCLEGHMVKWDGWSHAFGAVCGEEFVERIVR